MLGFVAFGFASQILLLAFFAAYRWQPELAPRLGLLVYGLGGVGLILAPTLAVAGQPWHIVLAPVLYAVWSAFGAFVDLVRPIPWRQPARLSILLPYVTLLVAALLALWIPIWYVDPVLWVLFGLLYAGHTTLNVASHASSGRARPG